MREPSSTDVDRKCKYYLCNKCIIPCSSCFGRACCEQCIYGYKTIVNKLLTKYTEEELESYKNMCIYADMAIKKRINNN